MSVMEVYLGPVPATLLIPQSIYAESRLSRWRNLTDLVPVKESSHD